MASKRYLWTIWYWSAVMPSEACLFAILARMSLGFGALSLTSSVA